MREGEPRMQDEEFTPREIGRLISSVDKLNDTISRLELRLNETIDRLEDRIARDYVTKETFRAAREADAQASLTLTEKVQRVSSAVDWAAKLIIGAVIIALLGLVVYTKNGGAVP